VELDQIIIKIDDEIYLSPLVDKDIASLVKHLEAVEISRRSLSIPYPYTVEHAEKFIRESREKARKYGHHTEWAIRKRDGELIGVIGWLKKYDSPHKDEIGYWLAKPYWGKGIMTKVLKKMSEIGFNELNLVRIEAPIFSFNLHSQKVAEKCGFVLEGVMRKAYYRDGDYLDGKMFALVKR